MGTVPITARVNIEKHIVQLLYAHDCVIVPGFGGFICDYAPAEINAERHQIYPPTKHIAFNAALKKNDGLLASFIASAEKIEYADAYRSVQDYAAGCNGRLTNRRQVEIEDLGVLHLDSRKNLQFKAVRSRNFLHASFGLAPMQLGPVIAGREREVQPYRKPVPVSVHHRKTSLRALELIPVAAMLALIVMIPTLAPRIDHAISSVNPFSGQPTHTLSACRY